MATGCSPGVHSAGVFNAGEKGIDGANLRLSDIDPAGKAGREKGFEEKNHPRQRLSFRAGIFSSQGFALWTNSPRPLPNPPFFCSRSHSEAKWLICDFPPVVPSFIRPMS